MPNARPRPAVQIKLRGFEAFPALKVRCPLGDVVMQGKYPAVLGTRSASVRRVDLGEKGVYYRAMVGPFGSSGEAAQLCDSLKTAGGQCVIQRN